MKRVLLILVVVMVAGFTGGCPEDSQDRLELTDEVFSKLASLSAAADPGIVAAQQKIAQLQLQALAPGMSAELTAWYQGALSQAKQKLNYLQAQKARYDPTAIEVQQVFSQAAAGGNANFGTELQAWGKGAQHVGKQVPGPIGSYIELGGWVLGGIGTLIGGVLANNQRKKRKTNEAETAPKVAAFEHVVTGLEILRRSESTEAGRKGHLPAMVGDALDGATTNADKAVIATAMGNVVL